MNPRIKELADQCWVSYSYEHAISSDKYKTVESSEFNKEKFAELITDKCVELALESGSRETAVKIIAYFGNEVQG